jgi:nitroreductase
MKHQQSAVLAHLLTRRTIPAARLVEPAPDPVQLADMLRAAVRVPDHGKLAPWRFIVFEGTRRAELTDRLVGLWREARPQATPEAEAVERGKLSGAPLVIAVVSRAAPHAKIPEWEQQLSAGAVCMNLVHAAHAQGFAAQWLTGWPAYDAGARSLMGLEDGEQIAGFIHVGTPDEAPVERDRPDIEALTMRWQG